MEFTLDGVWELTCISRPALAPVPFTFPGDVHSALLDAGILNDPYWARQEAEAAWVAECEWQITTTFDITEQMLTCPAVELDLRFVDTLAQIRVNGLAVADCDNMFRRYRINILQYLVAGTNRIEILFHPVAEEARERAEDLTFPVPWAKGNNQIPHMNLLRKPQCHAGWDWGICLPVMGVYESAFIRGLKVARLDSVETAQVWRGEGCDITVTLNYTPVNSGLVSANFSFSDQVKSVPLDMRGSSVSVTFHIDHPKRWWPAGYGEQALYSLAVELDGQVVEKSLGLRELEWHCEPDEAGESMELRVNGVPVSCRGANWVPLDAMPGRQTVARYRQLLEDAASANMNMLRVWGGGMYERDCFYRICDELGLLVWQDLMFSCALYPSNESFVDSVREELRYQIRRLKDHPSLALWCGDNEVIGAIGWYDESKANRERYVVNYDRLNRVLAEEVEKADPARRFWPSSPCNGDLDFGDAWHDDGKGDMHFWDVWHSGKGFDAYHSVKPRFCSEFGYQSWPSLPTVKTFAPEGDWNVTSPSFESHQKNARGNSIITEMFTRYFRFPNGFANMLYLSQVQQAMAIRTASEFWRAQKPVNRGILYWQLNDCWPVSSWSSIEYSGRWKMLHYHARHFFAPQMATFIHDSEGLSLHVVNDSREAMQLRGEVIWLSWDGEVLHRDALRCVLNADDNQVVWQWPQEQLDGEEEEGFFFVSMTDGRMSIENTWLPDKPKMLPLRDPDVRTEVGEDADGLYVMVSCSKPALYVFLEFEGDGRFEDNGFVLLPDRPRRVRFVGEADLQTLSGGLRSYDLYSSYN